MNTYRNKSFGANTIKSISIKDFVRAKKSATEKRKSNRNFLLMKLSTKSLKFKCGLANGGGGGGWSTHARHGYPHLVLYKFCVRLHNAKLKPFLDSEEFVWSFSSWYDCYGSWTLGHCLLTTHSFGNFGKLCKKLDKAKIRKYCFYRSTCIIP